MTTASTSPRTVSASSSAQPMPAAPAMRGSEAASSRAPTASTLWPVLATHAIAGRALGAGHDVAEAALAAEQVRDHRLALLPASLRSSLGSEMVHLHLIGPQQRAQLVRERAKDRLGIAAAVGEPHQPAQRGEQRVAVGARDRAKRDLGAGGGHTSDSRWNGGGRVSFL